MPSLEARLDALRERIQDEGFLHNKGLGNEVGFYVFDYPAARELEVRDFVARLASDSTLACHVVERNLWEALLQICREEDILDDLPAFEAEEGSDALLESLQSVATGEAFVVAMDYEPHTPGRDVVLVTGIGQVYPFMRAHSILENAQHVFCDVPLIMFYPGSYNQMDLKLFDKLEDSNYYRAFNQL